MLLKDTQHASMGYFNTKHLAYMKRYTPQSWSVSCWGMSLGLLVYRLQSLEFHFSSTAFGNKLKIGLNYKIGEVILLRLQPTAPLRNKINSSYQAAALNWYVTLKHDVNKGRFMPQKSKCCYPLQWGRLTWEKSILNLMCTPRGCFLHICWFMTEELAAVDFVEKIMVTSSASPPSKQSGSEEDSFGQS